MPMGTGQRGRHSVSLPRWSVRLAILGSSAAAAVAVSTLTRPGTAMVAHVHALLEFYSGVFSLVALSLTVMGGLAATERALFRVHQRVRLQIVHRALAFTSVAFLVLHVGLKILDNRAGTLDAVIPFLANHRAIPVGLGTIAAYVMVAVLWTGVVRARFAASGRPWLWRVQHSLAYVAWPIALFHGLEAGRAAKPWVTVSYAICLILVAIVLVVRFVGWLIRRTHAPRARTAPVVPMADAVPVFPALRATSGADLGAMTSVVHPGPAVVTSLSGRADGADLGFVVPGQVIGQYETAEAHPSRLAEPGRRRYEPGDGPPPRSVRNRVRHNDPRRTGVNIPDPRAELPSDASDEQFWAFMRGQRAR